MIVTKAKKWYQKWQWSSGVFFHPLESGIVVSCHSFQKRIWVLKMKKVEKKQSNFQADQRSCLRDLYRHYIIPHQRSPVLGHWPACGSRDASHRRETAQRWHKCLLIQELCLDLQSDYLRNSCHLTAQNDFQIFTCWKSSQKHFLFFFLPTNIVKMSKWICGL